MPSRHRSRERTLQMLYQWEASQAAPQDVISAYWNGLSAELGGKEVENDSFANTLFSGVASESAQLDSLIEKHASNWKLERMAAVDRGILRMATYELQQDETPAAIVINEALDLGRRFSGEQSARFLNGVLDAIRKSLRRMPASADTPH